jgi:hypothetical protein
MIYYGLASIGVNQASIESFFVDDSIGNGAI